MDEERQENQSILKDYEAKIIELRRAMQMKECFVQELEKKIVKNESIVAVPPNNVTMLFFNEIEELKKVIENLTQKNKLLEKENSGLRRKNDGITARMQLLEVLTLRSKLMFQEFKQQYSEEENDKRGKSAPRKDAWIPLKEQLANSKTLDEAQTKETREYS